MRETIPATPRALWDKLLPHHRSLLQLMLDEGSYSPPDMQRRAYCDTCTRHGWAVESSYGTFHVTDAGVARLQLKVGRPLDENWVVATSLESLVTHCGGLKPLSERIGVPVSTIKKWVTKGNRPSGVFPRKNLAELAAEIGVDLTDVLEPGRRTG